MRCDVVIVRYGEVGIKRQRARSRYERTLVRNIEARLTHLGIPYERIVREWGRLFIITKDERAAAEAANVFGVVSASPAARCAPVLDEVAEVAASVAAEHLKEGDSFAIRARRAGEHPFTSQEVAVVCGDAVRERVKGVHVDLNSPDVEVFVEVRQGAAYVYTHIARGVGGLPIGTQGKMVGLVSGGIDSPVACWLMMKRGCELVGLYIDLSPYADVRTKERAMDTLRRLSEWCVGHPIRVYEVPVGRIMEQIKKTLPPGMTCVLCKRMMYRIAACVMRREGALGIITGSSLGQVASQTAMNMTAEVHGMGVPIYHPLIAMDKTESIALARQIGTYSISTEPVGGCTAVPAHPRVSVKPDEVTEAERKIGLQELVEMCMQEATVHTLDPRNQ
ncbi:tRNA uracil 4-sulfurtransferase ThiI [Methermicoccus shengliensis]|uniref:Probable tRNA sulfurtransferase n=1 Tax=Methermicoccus shengliensis TaxID=660064 RepID=A0A832RVE4_9EURY|nr:tRNA uracil 4-sulfurtransferase ThiI [Methermicoccus shengliensis]KUK03956.1 MAG: putative tRNA sulfurtransferase [Euryarchaeota archaeon 55_53]KUK29583.1 MAG: putative tRNA sulfurtransferase [Methanosarcinales archeaon 56_1174]MDI3488702.1 tRNA uracil 4-sulfurtransferase [Methanosarcinales archaeon]MDN5295881.1 tRNA uracil 4-sulfurtransferase [Methanosarcinales archaeon]HIH69011.1 tRNA 4-thiouridine(8) synthase ThiI [Methermicoccus shengliensis]